MQEETVFFNILEMCSCRYRKALRMMKHAYHHGFPILSFIDIPGAYAGIKAEELGQVSETTTTARLV